MHRGDLSTIRDSFYWNSEWYAESKYYDLLFEDLKISSYLTGVFFKLRSPTSSFQIRRLSNNWVVITMDVYIITNLFFNNFFIKVDCFYTIYYYLRMLLKTKGLYLNSNTNESVDKEWPIQFTTNLQKDTRKMRRWLFPKKKRITRLSKIGTRNVLVGHRDNKNNRTRNTTMQKGKGGPLKADPKINHKSGLESLMAVAAKHAADLKAGIPDSKKRQASINRAQARYLRLSNKDGINKRHYFTCNHLNQYDSIVNHQKYNPHLTISQHKLRSNKILISDDLLDELRVYRKVLRKLKEDRKIEYNQKLSQSDFETTFNIDDLKISTDVLNESFKKALEERAKKYKYKKVKKASNYISFKESDEVLESKKLKPFLHRLPRVNSDKFTKFEKNAISTKRKYDIQKKLFNSINHDSGLLLKWVSSLTTLSTLVQTKTSSPQKMIFDYSNGLNKSWWLFYLFSNKLRVLGYFLMNKHAAKLLTKNKLKEQIKYFKIWIPQRSRTKKTLLDKKTPFSLYRRINRVLYKKIKRRSILHTAKTDWFKENLNFKKWICILENSKSINNDFIPKTRCWSNKLNSELRTYNMFSTKINIVLIIHIRYLSLLMNVDNNYVKSLVFFSSTEEFSVYSKTSWFFESIRFNTGDSEKDFRSLVRKKPLITDHSLDTISSRDDYYFINNNKVSNCNIILFIIKTYVNKSLNINVMENLIYRELSIWSFFRVRKPYSMVNLKKDRELFSNHKQNTKTAMYLNARDFDEYLVYFLDELTKSDLIESDRFDGILFNIIRILVKAKKSIKNPYFETLFFEGWCNETHLRVYFSWLVGYLCKVLLCVGSKEFTALKIDDLGDSITKSTALSLMSTTLSTMLSLASNLRHKPRSIFVLHHRLLHEVTFSYRDLSSQGSSSFLHVVGSLEPLWCYKHIRRQVRWVHTSLQYQSIMTQIEHSLARYSNKHFAIVPSFFYKRKPPLRSAKLLAEYIVLLLKNGHHILKIYKKIRRWQWRTKWYRFYWKTLAIWKKDIVHTLIGLRIACSGPFRKAKRKRRQHYHTWVGKVELFGTMSLQKMHHKVDYYGLAARVSHASRGIKVWMLFKPKKKKNEDTEKKTIYKENKNNKYKK